MKGRYAVHLCAEKIVDNLLDDADDPKDFLSDVAEWESDLEEAGFEELRDYWSLEFPMHRIQIYKLKPGENMAKKVRILLFGPEEVSLDADMIEHADGPLILWRTWYKPAMLAVPFARWLAKDVHGI